MTGRRAVAIGAFGVVMSLVAEHLSHSWEQPAIVPIADLAIGWAMLGSGLVATYARPRQAAGPRLAAAGLLWFVGTFLAADDPLVSDLGFAFQGYHDAVLLLIALSFPERWPARRDAWIVILAAALYATSTIVRVAARAIPDLGGPSLLPPDLGLALVGWTDFARLVAVVGGGILVVRRWVEATPIGRRTLGPVIGAGAASALAVAYAAYYPLTALGLVPPPDDSLNLTVAWLFNLVRVLVPVGMLVGILRQRAARSAIADAIASMGEMPSTIGLRAALAKALGDPGLDVLEWDGTAYVDEDGRTIGDLDAARRGRSVAMIESVDRPLAALVYDRALDEDPALVAAGTSVTRLVVQNERLAREVQQQLAEVQASRARIVEASDVERRRIERDLHDGLQQRLVALAMHLRRAQAGATETGAAQALGHGADEALGLIDDVRELARGIHPAVLAEGGLAAAIRGLADRSTIPVELSLELADPASTSVGVTAYFVISEALANVTKHAAARGAWIRARSADGRLEIAIEDDGIGGANPGSGLGGLADRVAALGGQFAVGPRPGRGTIVSASLPLD